MKKITRREFIKYASLGVAGGYVAGAVREEEDVPLADDQHVPDVIDGYGNVLGKPCAGPSAHALPGGSSSHLNNSDRPGPFRIDTWELLGRGDGSLSLLYCVRILG